MRSVFVLIIIICACGCQAAFAQSSFEPAVVILNSGDSLKGEIDNRDWNKNPDRVTYKNAGGIIIKYTPKEIRSFYLPGTGERYDAAIVSIDKTSLKPGDVMRSINKRGIVTDTVFLRRVANGRITLYFLMDEFSRIHLLTKKDGPIEELKLEMQRVLTPQEAVIPVERYKGQLAAMTADCAKEKFNINELKYTEKAIGEFVKRYNMCFATAGAQADPETSKTHFSFSLVGAANYSMLTVQLPGDGIVPPTDFKYGPEILPVGGIGAELTFPRKRESWSLYGDLIFRYYNMDGRFKASQIKFSTLVRYNIPVSDETRPFIGFGLTNSLALNYEVPYNDYRTYEQGLTVEAGCFVGRMSGWLRYERTNGFSPYPALGTKFNNWYLGFGYKLIK